MVGSGFGSWLAISLQDLVATMRRNSVASLAALLEPKTFVCPTCPLPQWDSRLSAFVVGLHPLPGQTHHNPNSKPYGIVSNHGKDTNSDAIKTIDSFFRSAVPICAGMYFKSTLYACKHSDSCTQVYHIPTTFLFEAFDDSNLYATVRFV